MVFAACLLQVSAIANIPKLMQALALGTRSPSLVLQVFATAGVSKRISVYEYANVLRNPHTETHCPALEVNTRSKLSCLSWNKYVQSHLASSDYEGVVNVWDVATSQSVAEYEAHEKRIWSVDSCHTDPMLLVTGSDDGWVKVSSRGDDGPAGTSR